MDSSFEALFEVIPSGGTLMAPDSTSTTAAEAVRSADQEVGKSRRSTSSTVVGATPRTSRPGRSGISDVVALHQRHLALGERWGRQDAAGGGKSVPDREWHRQDRAPAVAVAHHQLHQHSVGPDLRPAELVNARTLVGTDERSGGSLGDVADKNRLQARAAVSEEREDRQSADEAGQGDEEGVASADHYAGAEDGGVVAGGTHGVLAAPAGADVG